MSRGARLSVAAPYVAAALLSLLFVVRFWDPDVFWHLATGRWIALHHAVPRVDPFSFTVPGAPWRTVDWLAELALYGAYAALGWRGLGLYDVLCAFVLLAALAATLRQLGVRASIAIALLACVAVIVQPRYAMGRPMTLGAALLSLSIFIAARAWYRDTRGLWALCPLVGVWSLCHPSAILGVALAGAFAAAALLADRTRLSTALLVLGACVLVMVASPDGRGILFHAGELERFPLALALTVEWKRTSLGDRALWVPAALCLGGLVACLGRARKVLPLVFFGVAGIAIGARYQRNTYEAVVMCAPLAGAALESAAAWLERRGLDLARRALPLAVALVAGLHLALAPHALDTDFGVGPSGALVPKQTFALLASLPAARTIHDCSFGGYLIWERVPVYCDGRAIALYTEDDVERLFVPLYSGGAALDAVADHFGVRYALARPDTDFERALMRDAAWVPLAFDRESTLFSRRGAPGVQPLDDLRFVADAAWLDAFYGPRLADAAGRARVGEELTRAFTIALDSPTLRAIAVEIGRRSPELREQLTRALDGG
jgi:hypothetical protein